MTRLITSSALLILLTAAFVGCSTAPSTEGKKIDLEAEASTAVTEFKTADPSLQRFFDNAYGYAVFPTVAKGAFVVGGAGGRGIVREQGRMVGYATLSQATVGAQIGGQGYRQVIFFQYKEALDHFKTGNFALAAQASAIAVTAGASADADYDRGVAVFTMGKGGLMVEASVGGQKFAFARR